VVHDKPRVILPPGADAVAAVFDDLPRVMFSLKAVDGRYLRVNQAFADRAGHKTAATVIGRRAAELFSPELALSYEAQDRALVESRRPVRRQLELITRPDGTLGWYVTNKSLLLDETGQPAAIVAASVDEESPAGRSGMAGLDAALAAARTRFAHPLTASDLARAAAMPTALLERRMRRLIGVAPTQLIVRVRVEEAVHRIVHGDRGLAQVAVECGFSDHAAMTRHVKRLLGVTPSELRAAGRTGSDRQGSDRQGSDRQGSERQGSDRRA
jgi:PAS domain S-box-containing protein